MLVRSQLKLLIILVVLVCLTDSRRRRKRKKKVTIPRCSAPTEMNCTCWYDLSRSDCPCCVEDYCIQTTDNHQVNEKKECMNKKLYQKSNNKPYILDTEDSKLPWCYGHAYWCAHSHHAVAYCVFPGMRCRRGKHIQYTEDLCGENASLTIPDGEKYKRCVCNDGYVGNGKQCVEPNEEFIEVPEPVDPSQIVKISFEIESNSTLQAVSEMEALKENCDASTCDMQTS